MKAIEVENVTFAYGKNLILENVNFSVEEGDFLALIGPNGGGKTTLLKVLVGLLKPQEGSVKIFGERVPNKKNLVGYVPQNTNANVEFPITVAQCVATGKYGLKADSAEVSALLARVGMAGFETRRLGALSGGQRQRVLVARALAAKPKILFLDEPSSSMDAAGQASLFNLLAELNAEMTIVLVSHDLMALSKHVKSVACVNGCVHFHGGNGLNGDVLHEAYGCDMELITHGMMAHRVLSTHDHTHCHEHSAELHAHCHHEHHHHEHHHEH